jgi:hypothetical protein
MHRETEPAPPPNSSVTETMEKARAEFKQRYAEANAMHAADPTTKIPQNR